MKKQKVVIRKQLPSKPPVVGTAFWLVVMDLYNVPGWVFGVAVTLLAIGWFAFIYGMVMSDPVELKELGQQ